MKKKLEELILQAIESLKAEGVLDIETIPQITIDRTRDASHGDFASNLALLLAKPAKSNPKVLMSVLESENFWNKFGFQNQKTIDYYGLNAVYMVKT